MNDKDLRRIKRVLANGEKLRARIVFTGTTRDSFIGDTSESGLIAYDAIMILVLQIVEDAGMLSDDVKAALPAQPWRNIKGFRNLLAHVYYQVDKEMAWDIVSRDIPSLCESLAAICEGEEAAAEAAAEAPADEAAPAEATEAPAETDAPATEAATE